LEESRRRDRGVGNGRRSRERCGSGNSSEDRRLTVTTFELSAEEGVARRRRSGGGRRGREDGLVRRRADGFVVVGNGR